MHERHQEWLHDINSIPIITIDTGIYDIYKKEHQEEITQKINEFIHKIDRIERAKTMKMKEQAEQVKVAAWSILALL